jgi:hypothetical protein
VGRSDRNLGVVLLHKYVVDPEHGGMALVVNIHLPKDSLRGLMRKSDPASAGMGSHNLPTVVKLLEIHGGVADHL